METMADIPEAHVHVSKLLSSGAYGTVYTIKEDDSLVVKRNYVDELVDNMGMIREIDIANHLNGHPCIVELKKICLGCPIDGLGDPEISTPDVKDDKIYPFFERSSANVYDVFKKYRKHVRRMKEAFAQILLGLEFMHAKGYIHQDVKPNNFLFFATPKDQRLSKSSPPNDKGWLKLCDFGLSRPYVTNDICCFAIGHIDYRAPEIMLEHNYDFKIDIWSAACVMLEIMTGVAQFHYVPPPKMRKKSRDEEPLPQDEVLAIMKQIIRDVAPRTSPESILALIRKPADDCFSPTGIQEFLAMHMTPRVISELSSYPSRLMFPLFPDIDSFNSVYGSYPDFIDMIFGMLAFDPTKRLSATEALNHRFFDSMRGLINAVRCTYPPGANYPEILDFSPCRYRIVACRLIWDEIVNVPSRPFWFTWHKIFFALDIFDRYNACPGEFKTLIQKQYGDPDLVSRFEIVSALYLSHKYLNHSDLTTSSFERFSMSYLSMSGKMETWLQGIFEAYVIRAFSGHIYRPTLLHAADRFGVEPMTDMDLKELFVFYSGLTSKTQNIYEIFTIFQEEKMKRLC